MPASLSSPSPSLQSVKGEGEGGRELSCAASTRFLVLGRDVEDGGGEGHGGGGERRRGGRAAGGGPGAGGGGAGAARGDAAARGAAGALRRRHGRHAPRFAEQRVRRRLLLRPRRIQVPGVRQRAVRGLLAGLGVLHRRAAAGDALPLLGRLPPRPGVHLPDPGRRRVVGGAALPGVQRRQGGDVERGVWRVRQLLPAGAYVGRHHLRLRRLLHPPLPHLLLPPLQRLRGARALARQQGRRDRRLPALSCGHAGVCGRSDGAAVGRRLKSLVVWVGVWLLGVCV